MQHQLLRQLAWTTFPAFASHAHVSRCTITDPWSSGRNILQSLLRERAESLSIMSLSTGTASALDSTQTHLCLRGILFTMIHPGQVTSDWSKASAMIFQVLPAAVGLQSPHWALGIYPSTPHDSHMVSLTSSEWTIQWDEAMGMVTLQKQKTGGDYVQHCLLIQAKADFLAFASICSNVRMLMYTGQTAMQ
ncbi:hypothetical protein OH77DRAFT_1460710 [Trametes cingulata]|nr:hypothetical protein OH77DRAFT_1460710 [Trametes cingulata]